MVETPVENHRRKLLLRAVRIHDKGAFNTGLDIPRGCRLLINYPDIVTYDVSFLNG
jgi:hypothetical protein